MARTLDPDVDEAIVAATMALLGERGFGAMTIEAVAVAAGVGKPAIYRRFADKAELATAVVSRQLRDLEVPELGDTREELWLAVERGFPADAPAYLRLIGGLAAEEKRHPELIAAFRENVLGPRREAVRVLIERGQARGDLRPEVDPVAALDALAGPLLARAFAGVETGPEWRRSAFELWWDNFKTKEER
ncbi:MAG TPA: TetR/AcrR family transcriptional regulator [Solirubrobacterales bacterium]|nr:TetR/AcrR family transcriptional regulator [Solirubrobacterales bacterium]